MKGTLDPTVHDLGSPPAEKDSTSPSAPPAEEITALLRDWRDGDPQAFARLMPLVYGELRRLAARYMAAERADHTLGATALVHEAYLRFAGGGVPSCRDRSHFFALAAQVMRRLLVDHARAQHAAKRGNGAPELPLEQAAAVAAEAEAEDDLVALDEALADLAILDPRKVQIVELRFFAGLTIAETAEAAGVSTATVILETRLARAWLFRRMRETRRVA